MSDVYKIGGRVLRFTGQADKFSSNIVTAYGDILMYGFSRIEYYPGQDIVSYINPDGSAEIITVNNEPLSYTALLST